MEFITTRQALAKIQSWLNIPDTHELQHSTLQWNFSPDQTPLYIRSMEWNQKGELELDENGLIHAQVIHLELDAITGAVQSFHKHDHRPHDKSQPQDMEEATYTAVYPHILEWIRRLELPIDPSELRLQGKRVTDGRLYQLDYGRQHQGVPVGEYQHLRIWLDASFELVSLQCKWDACVFEDITGLLPIETFVKRLGPGQLSLCYPLVVSMEYPVYAWSDDVFDAVTGQLIYSDHWNLIRKIDSSCPDAGQSGAESPIEVLKAPIFSEKDFDELNISSDLMDPAMLKEHPHARSAKPEESQWAMDLASSYVRRNVKDELPFEYAFMRREGQEAVERMPGNQLRVDVQRLLYGIPVVGGRIRLALDRNRRVINHSIDGLEMIQLLKESDRFALQPPRISIEEAWEAMHDKLDVQCIYRWESVNFMGQEESPTVYRAVPVYSLDSHCMLNAVTGHLIDEKELL
jgi:hypothetical protein